MKRAGALLAAAALAAGCGAGADHSGTASVWVTRDRGAHVLVVGKVPAGLTAVQALRRVADVKTRYGGRFVQSIEGLSGSLSAQRDWFYFVNGYEADVGAAEYRLHPGDVEWWDYRSWAGGAYHVPVVVGAFPEPFLHGYDGKRLPATVLSRDAKGGRAVARALQARFVRLGVGQFTASRAGNMLFLEAGGPGFTASAGRAGGPVSFTFAGDWHDLLAGKYRYRYSVP